MSSMEIPRNTAEQKPDPFDRVKQQAIWDENTSTGEPLVKVIDKIATDPNASLSTIDAEKGEFRELVANALVERAGTEADLFQAIRQIGSVYHETAEDIIAKITLYKAAKSDTALDAITDACGIRAKVERLYWTDTSASQADGSPFNTPAANASFDDPSSPFSNTEPIPNGPDDSPFN